MLFADKVISEFVDKDRELLFAVDRLMRLARQNLTKLGVKGEISFECHSICRAIVLEIADGSVSIVDGEYLGIEQLPGGKARLYGASHTWLVTSSGAIIDPYPIGMLTLSPLLLVAKGVYRDFASTRYRPNPEVTEECGGRKAWRKARILQKYFRPPSN